jgi:pimeloyl-ACP methyl ester carboxylesterase
MKQLLSALLDPFEAGPLMDARIVELGAETVTLTAVADAASDGVFGMYGDGGYAQVGPILARRGETVVRPLAPMTGSFTVGGPVGVSPYAFPRDPRTGRGLDYHEVDVPGPLGPMPAWLVPAGARWAIFVHGRGATREEGLRVLGVLNRLGMTTLLVTYRNDRGAPPSPDGLYHLGGSEWEDVESAVDYAIAAGAEDVVLVASSMGAAICCRFLRMSALAGRVSAAVFDAPLLDWNATLRRAARRRGVSRPVELLAKRAVGRRIGVHWSEFDNVSAAAAFRTPMLIVHGTADATIPFSTSARFALRRPDLVELVAVPRALHGRSWNHDPTGYEHAVEGFLTRLYSSPA